MSVVNILPNAEQIDQQNIILARMADKMGAFDVPTTWKGIQAMVRMGLAKRIFAIGDQLTCQKGNVDLVWDIIGIDEEIPIDPNLTHSMTLQLHNEINCPRFNEKEAFFSAVGSTTYANGVQAGTYNFIYNGTSYQFTLTKSLPNTGIMCFTSQSNINDLENAQIQTFNNQSLSASVETTNIYVGNSGTNLGTFSTTQTSGELNIIYPVFYSSNDWQTSNIRQWLNSSENSLNWWNALSIWKRGESYSPDGFLRNIDDDFLNVVGQVTKTIARGMNCGEDITTETEKFFLLSKAEVYGGNIAGVGADGSVYSFYGAGYSDLPSAGTGYDSNRIKYYNNNRSAWMLRTPNLNGNTISNKYGVFYIESRGDIGQSHAHTMNLGYCSPACVII